MFFGMLLEGVNLNQTKQTETQHSICTRHSLIQSNRQMLTNSEYYQTY